MRWALFFVLLFCLSCAEKEVRREERIDTPTEASQIDHETIEKEEPQEIVSTRKQVIGCILPLSGKYSKFGQRSLRGIQLAFSFFSDGGAAPYELAIYDSRGIPEEAERGVGKLLEEDQAIAVLGPLLTSSSEKAARRAEQLKIPMINLSQHPTITTT
ncbi:MAG: ABC transporter substrate-binding protein, partial [Deltaproteobacteria bacterium]